jgi:hypothetical protein
MLRGFLIGRKALSSKRLAKNTALAMASLVVLATATPASAAVTINAGGSTTTLNPLQSATFNFNGISDGNVVSGLSSSLLLTLTSQTANQTVLGFTLSNLSNSPITSSMITAFGFDVAPDILNAAITGAIFTGIGSGNIANARDVEVCFTAGGGSNCAGAGSGNLGLAQGSSTSGSITLNFSGDASNITLSDLAVRYQAMVGGTATSATGGVVPSVPEPATWALMLIGFGAIGYSMRRGRRTDFLAQAA